ncbi:hypothetical protein VTI28DRAFT_4110 [Corynascus sepedonium]
MQRRYDQELRLELQHDCGANELWLVHYTFLCELCELCGGSSSSGARGRHVAFKHPRTVKLSCCVIGSPKILLQIAFVRILIRLLNFASLAISIHNHPPDIGILVPPRSL